MKARQSGQYPSAIGICPVQLLLPDAIEGTNADLNGFELRAANAELIASDPPTGSVSTAENQERIERKVGRQKKLGRQS
ncbi:MAG: hypothetical protein PGN33_07125 [Methylobacterium radiotolerans]